MNSYQNMTVGEIVAIDIRYAQVFGKYTIDFCCGGNRNLAIICQEKGIEIQDVLRDLEKLEKSENQIDDFLQYELDLLVDYIVNKYHTYTKEALTFLMQYSEKVAKVHGNKHPEVIELYKQVSLLQGELIEHMRKEEKILFPYIKKLVHAKRTSIPMIRPAFGSIENPIGVMSKEHIEAGDALKIIEKLSENFVPPEGACNTFRALYSKLEEFQSTTFEHIHLENNILFPKAILLEKELFNI